MTAEIRVTCGPGEMRVAVVVNDVLSEYAIWRPGAPDGVGDIHRGRVLRVVSAMAGAFVVLADAEGFLSDSEGAKGLTEGTILTVRVSRSAQGGKGPRLSARPELVGRTEQGGGQGVGLVRRGPDAVTRLAAAWPDAPVLIDDAGAMAMLRPTLGDRLRLARDAFDDALLADTEALAESAIVLDSGARLSFHPTPALTAIDVDTASALGTGSGAKTGRHDAVNRALIPDLTRQIRLRNLSGAILVDFAGMQARKRATLAAPLAEALGRDTLRPRLLGFTGLGLAEIVRARVHPPLHEVLAGPHAAGLTALRQLAAAVAADPSRIPALRAAPAVATALRDDLEALADLARRTGRTLVLRSDPGMGGTGWMLDADHG